MKRIAFTICLLFSAVLSFAQETPLKPEALDSFYLLSPVEVKAVRAGEKAPFTKTNLSRKEIEKNNLGQDIPFILNQTPSVVANSDAGNGVGYTGLRIRGTDATRINVTLNGIPYNDAESQGTFLVDLPDFASSVNSIQIQRGVGTSSNGAGAFGATLSLSTNEINRDPYAELNNSYGSFNTRKNTVKAGTGILNDHFTVDARLSQITSNGYIDRATSNLQAFYISGAYINDKSSIRLNVFSGKEKTFQAWNGIPESKLKGNYSDLLNHYYNNLGALYFTEADSVNLFSSGNRTYNLPLYGNETDNYRQTHYQVFYNLAIDDNWRFNTAAFLTRGIGYYENYKSQQKYSDYGLPDFVVNDSTFGTTDLVRQKWLDNYFYGQVLSVQYRKDKNDITLGGSWTRYDGNHYGDIIWAQYGIEKDHRYYDLDALKSDINAYLKWQYELSANWNLFADLQYRHVRHKMNGFEDNPSLMVDRKFDFLNPKIGLKISTNGWQSYISYAVANKEPNRDDFEAGTVNQPQKETLHDIEAGVEKRTTTFFAGATLYYMFYKDQLVLTGMVNDVGAYTRVNVPNSYRLGIELQGACVFNNWLNASGNLALSRNKIKSFTEYLDDYDANFDWKGQHAIVHKNTDISFSPAVVGAATINILPLKNLEINLLSKYVGTQYLDNTQSATKKLNPFYTQDVRFNYVINEKLFKEWNVVVQVNNVFNRKYEPNGYTYGYIYDGSVVTENFFFPMAGINYILALNIKL